MKHLGFVLIVLLLISSGSSLAAQSGDQGQIVFSADISGDFDIYRMDVASGDLRQLTDDPATDLNPVWSPDGQQIVFQSDRDGNQEIYVMQADGSQVQRLTSDPGDDTIPAWSPDGRWIVFSADRDGDFEIYVMEADGSHVQPLTVNPTTQDSQPVWAPDGFAGVLHPHLCGRHNLRRDDPGRWQRRALHGATRGPNRDANPGPGWAHARHRPGRG